MNFEINVSLKGQHLFATHERSCDNSTSAQKVLDILIEKFPTSEGYKITCSAQPRVGFGVDINIPLHDEANRIYSRIK